MKRDIGQLLFSRLFFPILSVIFVSAFYISASKISPEASSYPKGIIAVLAILLIWTFIAEVKQWWKNDREKVQTDKGQDNSKLGRTLLAWWKEYHKSVYTAALLFIYLVIVKYVGFFVSSGLFLISLFYLLGLRNHMLVIILTLSVTLSSFAAFRLWLRLPLPEGFLF